MDFNFQLLNKNMKTNDYINKLLINYPKSEIVLKNNIKQTLYSCVELIFSYKINDNIRINY